MCVMSEENWLGGVGMEGKGVGAFMGGHSKGVCGVADGF